MKYSEGNIGRVFVVRLEEGDWLPQSIEILAKDKEIKRGICLLVGGIKGGGTIVAGPRQEDAIPIETINQVLNGIHEIVAIGTIFPDEDGIPKLHMHAALGRDQETITGCVRLGIETWKVGEVILLEIINNHAHRIKETATGFELLEP
ncbi:MAG: DNA-binding protein [bacterium]|nr:DNA-binding protein [bacterium]